MLHLAASLDQYSRHVPAQAIVDAARERGLAPSVPSDVTKEPGRGASGVVDGHRISVGRTGTGDIRPGRAKAVANRAPLDGAAVARLTVDGQSAGAVLLRPPLRHDAPHAPCHRRSAGIGRLPIPTGDRTASAHEVAAVLGLDACAPSRALPTRSPWYVPKASARSP